MAVKGCPLWVEAKEEWPRGCQSWVRITWSNRPIRRLTKGKISSPFGTASAPPGQKSFCTSMTISASSAVGVIFPVMAALSHVCGNYRRALGQAQSDAPLLLSRVQPLGGPADVVGHGGGEAVVGVIVPRLHAQGQRHAARLARLGEQFRPQLLLEELVGIALVDQDVARPAAAGQQRTGIILAPRLLVRSQIGVEGLLPPGRL